MAAPSFDFSRFHGMLLGRGQPMRQIGFGASSTIEAKEDVIRYSGDAHLCTVAPTRSGKGVGVIIPNLLTYEGPVVVFDPKGENYQVTARRRRELGQRAAWDFGRMAGSKKTCCSRLRSGISS